MWGEWIRRPKGDAATIFIHGILSSGETAWKNDNGAYWPDLLKNESKLDSLGIYVFTYETGIFSPNYSLSDVVDALDARIELDEIWHNKQLIFVCHSMGGIVARKYITANEAKFIASEKEIGLFLIASPSQGSPYADWLMPIAKLFSHKQLDVLRFVAKNEWLSDLDKDFMNVKDGLKIKGKELVEDSFVHLKSSKVPDSVKNLLKLLWKKQIVEEWSARRYFPKPLKVPKSDHFSIAKPVNEKAIQHELLRDFIYKNFIAGDKVSEPPRRAPTEPQVSPLTLDGLTRAAIAADKHGLSKLPDDHASAHEVYDVAIDLASGRIFERVMSSWLVKQQGDPITVYQVGLDRSDATRFQFRSSARWLRFVAGLGKDKDVAKIAKDVIKKLALKGPDACNLSATIMGAAGAHWEIDTPEWDTNSWMLEKCAHAYLAAYCTSASVHTAHDFIDSALWLAVKVSRARANFRPFDAFDYYSTLCGIPESHGSIVLDKLIQYEAPEAMVNAFLWRLCLIPTEKTLPHLQTLARHENEFVRRSAHEALAFIPGRTAGLAETKRSILSDSDNAFTIAIGVDHRVEALPMLDKLVSQAKQEDLQYNAAWSLCRLARVDPAAKSAALHHAKESDNHLVRAILLAGLAPSDPKLVAEDVALLLPSSLEEERLVLLVAQSYISDSRDLLSMIASCNKDYPFHLMSILQLIFSDAIKHAASSAPLLGQLWRLGDLQI